MNTRVDDPDAGGEVGAAVVHVGVAAGAGALAQRAVDAQLAARASWRVAASASSSRSSLSGAQPRTPAACAPVGGGELGAGARRAASAASSSAPSSMRTA